MEASNLIGLTNVDGLMGTNYERMHILQEITILYSYP